ncbi:MAG: RDD family protein [Actinobacteria bacterium]|nr:RDD family protein [Actinomycetota bacterium]
MRVPSTSSLVSRERRYEDPSHRYVAEFASPWRRAAAAAIDWGLLYVAFLVLSIPLGVVESLGAISNEAGDLGGRPGHILVVAAQLLMLTPAVAYFTIFLPTSQTPGMRVMELRSVAMSTGRGLSRTAAGVRAAFATVAAVACYAVFLWSSSFEKTALDRTSEILLDAAYLIASAAFASALVMSFTPTRRSLADRAFGTAIVDDLEPVAPLMGPWGPLNAFDTSSSRRPERELSA